jgi:hypothetical protein
LIGKELAMPATTTPPLRAMPHRVEWVILAIILTLAGTLRFYHLDTRAFWTDELFTLESITQGNVGRYAQVPWNQVTVAPELTRPPILIPWLRLFLPDPQDIHPPLYYVLIRAWANLFGFSEFALRAFSAVASLAAVALLYFTVRELAGRAAASWAALIMSLASPQIEYAQEARSYALVLCISLAACLSLVRIIKHGVQLRRLVILSCLVLAMLETHYFTLAAIAVFFVFAALCLQARDRRRTCIAIGGACALFGLLNLHSILIQRHGISGAGTTVFTDSSSHHFTSTFERLALLPARFLAEPVEAMRPIAALMALVCLIPFALLRKRRHLLLWALWVPACAAPALITDMISGSASLERVRYTLLASPGVYALFSMLCGKANPLFKHLVPALATLYCLLSVLGPYERPNIKWRDIGTTLSNMTEPGDIVVFGANPDSRETVLTYLLCMEHYGYPWRGPIVLLEGKTPSKELLERLAAARGIVLFSDGLDGAALLPHSQLTAYKSYPRVGEIQRLVHGTNENEPR